MVNEVISIINDNDFIQRSDKRGEVLEYELKSLLKKHRCIKAVRGIGLMFIIEFYKDEKFYLENIHKEFFDAGYITGVNISANILRFYPPLTIEEMHIKSMVSALDMILLEYC